MRVFVDDASVFVADGGRLIRPQTPSILLLHGAGMDHTVWGGQTRALAHRGVNVIAPDLPGHGGSEGPAYGDIAGMADWAARLVDALGLGRVLVVGHSMGALVALSLAGRHKDKAAGLMLLGAGASMPVHPDLLAAARDDLPRAAGMIAAWAHGPDARRGGHPMPGLWMEGLARRLLEHSPPGVLAGDLKACADWADSAAMAGAVTCPVDIVIGTQDRMTPPKAGRALAGLFGTAHVTEIAGAGHMMMTEEPEAVRQAFYDALARLGQEGDAP